jgi:hypothetical protein
VQKSAIQFKIVVAVCAVASLFAAAGASAATKEYAPDPQSRNFNGGDGGWSLTTEYGGLCIPGLTCYTVGAENPANGGPNGAGDGFLRLDLFTVAQAVTETRAILTSPSFTYRGAGGKIPRRLTFSLDRRTDLGAVLPAINNNASYNVKAVPAGGSAETLIDERSLGGAEDEWTRVDPVMVDPKQLKIGTTYKLRITTTFQPANIAVLDSGTVDYDNVVLRARGGGGGGGGQGNAGPGGGFTTAIKNLIGNATLKGRNLRVPAGCPRFLPKTCSLKVVAKLNRKGRRATSTDKLRVKPGGKKTAVLRVKSDYLSAVKRRNRIVVRVRAKSGDRTRTVIKSVKIKKA